MSEALKGKVIEAFCLLVSEWPCCSCCSSDEGYMDTVIQALEILEPELSRSDRVAIQKKAHKDFLNHVDWDDWVERGAPDE